MKKLDIGSIDVDSTEGAIKDYAKGKNVEVTVWFTRDLTDGELARAKEAAKSCIADDQQATVTPGKMRFRFFVRDGGPVERFVEIVRSDGSKWDDEVARELKQAESALQNLESSLQAFVGR